MAAESEATRPRRNPIINPSFEDGDSAPRGWRFDGRLQHAALSWAREGAHSGQRCLAFFPSMQAATWESDPVPVVAGTPYGLTWWTRFEGSEPWHWSYHSEFVGVAVRFLDGNGAEVGTEKRKFHCLATAGWQQAWIKLTPPADAKHATIAFVYRTGIETDGRVWVDDADIEPLDAPPRPPSGLARILIRTLDVGGKPFPARMWARTAGGEYVSPRYSYRFNVPDVGFHAAPEDCWLDVPPGEVTVGARRGFEFAPIEQTVRVAAGETREVALVLRRTIDMRAQGWLAGDHHSHLFFHKSTQHPQMRPQEVFAIARAEGLNYLSLDGEMIEFRANLQDHDKARDADFVGEMGLEAVTDFYGHLCLINVRHDMPGGFPMRMVFWPPNEEVMRFAASQGAAVVSAHPLNTNTLDAFINAVASERGCLARELAMDILLGRTVSFDIFSESGPPQRASDVAAAYYHLLNLGRRAGVTASTDYYVDQGRGACGAWRTYARCDRLDFAEIAGAYREGRTFATNGPLVLFHVNGAGPGDEVSLAAPGEVEVSLRAQSQWGLEGGELVINGVVVRQWDAIDGRLDVTDRVRIDETSWVAARVFGPKSAQVDSSPMAEESGELCGQFAHTSPVYVSIAAAPFRPRRDAVEFCMQWVAAMETAVNAAKEKYLLADLSAYGLTGADAFDEIASRIAEARAIAQRMLEQVHD